MAAKLNKSVHVAQKRASRRTAEKLADKVHSITTSLKKLQQRADAIADMEDAGFSFEVPLYAAHMYLQTIQEKTALLLDIIPNRVRIES